MKITFASSNRDKLERVQRLLADCQVSSPPATQLANVSEQLGSTPVDVSLHKAVQCLALQLATPSSPLLTQDDGLVLDGVDKQDQVGVSIKRPVVERYGEFNQDLARAYYHDLIDKYGGEITGWFRYGHTMAWPGCNGESYCISKGSELPIRLSVPDDSVNEITDNGYFLRPFIYLLIEGSYIPYLLLDSEQLNSAEQGIGSTLGYLVEQYRALSAHSSR